ncbi:MULTISPECIES: 3-deoxy-7-phosphoheptulonate synthase [Streptomyces]|uniref:3-deoxy-7-phosphoheptulonate synthase n=1 Tax=Streptomyces TaxID=1883 RepID=UPI0029CDE4C1|nr:3-deoxy-7-phosphoheptulonate synthase [Streptomyces sp. F8]MDX6758018.1 3-deoxy-7-phosphoheptulonate synthase [Streptomyces sp. F8]
MRPTTATRGTSMPHDLPLLDKPGWYGGEPYPADALEHIAALPAPQQPDWAAHEDLPAAVRDLRSAPGLVGPGDVDRFGLLVAEAAQGSVNILQAGDCAEDPADCTPGAVRAKVRMLDALAAAFSEVTGRPTVRVGRMGGQYAKPRSRPTERHRGRELPVFRGHMVNGPEPDAAARRHDPRRLTDCYRAALSVHAALRPDTGWTRASTWSSHEALVLDYELPLVRGDGSGRALLSSTHWPWIGERTRSPRGAHARLLATVDNPVACKVGPTTTRAELMELCGLLDPERRPGRLTLIARQGAAAVRRSLPPLVECVRRAGHPVVWMCDPMHGNTVTTPAGRKTRLVEDVVREVRGFRRAVESAGGTAGGLHLEATADDVLECVADAAGIAGLEGRARPLCDPRLNLEQALTAVSAWRL